MNHKKQIILISFAFTIAFLLVFIFIIYPFLKDIKKASDELILQKEKLTLKRANLEEIEKSQFKKHYEDLESNFNKMQQFFISADAPVDFIEFLEKTANETGLIIDINITSLNASKDDFWNFLGFRLTVKGPFFNFSKFLQKIETSHYLVQIQNINIRKVNAEEAIKDKSLSEKEVFADLILKVFTK